MKIKVSDLVGVQLDWAVAKSLGLNAQWSNNVGGLSVVEPYSKEDRFMWEPSTDWHQGGQLVERFKVHIVHDHGRVGAAVRVPTDRGMKQAGGNGETILIASMRAIVSASLGEEIEVPEGLQP